MNMKIGLLVAGLSITTGGWALAETAMESKEKPGVVDAAAATVTATVDSIDYKTRMITLKGPDGTLETMQVGPEVTRLDEVKKGDEITIDYLESVAVVVQSPDKTIASAEGSNTITVRNKSKRPSGMIIETDMITATVEKIDAKKRTATLRGPQGNKIQINVAPDVENLQNVKKGDQVLVKYTRTVALAVSKPVKK